MDDLRNLLEQNVLALDGSGTALAWRHGGVDDGQGNARRLSLGVEAHAEGLLHAADGKLA